MKIVPYAKNAKQHPDNQVELIANSIIRFGWQQPIVVDTDGVIIVGHGRNLAYELKGEEMDEPWITDNEGKTLSGKQGKKLNKEEVKAYRLADNKISESDWDMDLVMQELKEIGDLVSYTGFNDEEDFEDDNPYTSKIESPVYEASDDMPEKDELYDLTKFEELQKELDNAKIDEADKAFLRLASYRHIAFDYGKIADYYAHSSKEVQELMENSALVIIDFHKSIEKGFTVLTEEMDKQFLEEYGEK